MIIKVGGSKGDVTKRWLQVSQDDRKEKAQSLEVSIYLHYWDRNIIHVDTILCYFSEKLFNVHRY